MEIRWLTTMSVTQLLKILKTRLAYARFKVQHGMIDKDLDQIQHAVDRRLRVEAQLKAVSYELPPTPPRTQQRSITTRQHPQRQRHEEEIAAQNLMLMSSPQRRSYNRPLSPDNSPVLPSFQDVVAQVPGYDEKSFLLAESLRSSTATPPPAAPPYAPDMRSPYFPPPGWSGVLPTVTLSPTSSPVSHSKASRK